MTSLALSLASSSAGPTVDATVDTICSVAVPILSKAVSAAGCTLLRASSTASRTLSRRVFVRRATVSSSSWVCRQARAREVQRPLPYSYPSRTFSPHHPASATPAPGRIAVNLGLSRFRVPRFAPDRDQGEKGGEPQAGKSDGNSHRDRPSMVSATVAGGRPALSALVRERLVDHNSGSGPRRNGTAFADSPQSKPVRARPWRRLRGGSRNSLGEEFFPCLRVPRSTRPVLKALKPAHRPRTPWFKNPSYPDRTHQADRARLAASLKACDEKLAEVRKKLGLLANHARRGSTRPSSTSSKAPATRSPTRPRGCPGGRRTLPRRRRAAGIRRASLRPAA